MAAIREGGIGIHIDGIGLHILGHRVALTKLGFDIVLPIHHEQALVQQREQHPVGVIRALVRVGGTAGIVGQHQFLICDLLRLGLGRAGIILIPCQTVTGGNIFATLFLTSRQQAEQQHAAQKHAQYSLHLLSLLANNDRALRTPRSPRHPMGPEPVRTAGGAFRGNLNFPNTRPAQAQGIHLF